MEDGLERRDRLLLELGRGVHLTRVKPEVEISRGWISAAVNGVGR
jgi:hypothetical protein